VFADIRGIARRLVPPISIGARKLVLSITLVVRRLVPPILE
jgi:hypothetical protein